MSEENHSWDRVPAWDGDERRWKRYLRDVELYLETEKLDVDFSHGARLLSRIELDTIRRSTGADKDTQPNDRFKNRFRKPRDGKSGRYTAHETDARDTEDDPNSEEEVG